MSLGKKLFIGGGGGGTCPTDSVQPFGADSAYSSNVALYQLDSDGGTTNNVPDTVGNYNGTASNVTYSTGKYGNAAVFDGSSSNIFNSNRTSTQTTTITLSAWINTTDTTSSMQILQTESLWLRANQVWRIDNANGTGAYRRYDFTQSTIATGNWVHVCVVRDGNSVTLYVNNSAVSFSSETTSSNSSVYDGISIGARNRSSDSNKANFFDGKIDQVRLYDKALSPDEVTTLYNETTSTASDTNVLGEGSGVALYSLDYDASDASGNYNGTPSNIEFGVEGQINYGASFNGSSSKIDLGNNFNLTQGQGFTISMWVNPDSVSSNFSLISKDNSTNRNWTFSSFTGSESTPRFFIKDTSNNQIDQEFTSQLSAGTWSHLVVTWNGGLNATDIKLYFDGNLEPDNQSGSATISNVATNTQSTLIGDSGNYGNHFDGKIDQVRIFEKALSQDEVDTLYAETACVYTSTTDQVDYQGTNLAYYKFDNTAEDETGNYDGTESNITYEFGRFGQAAVFNDSAITTSLNIGRTNDFTISLWVKDVSDSNYGSYGFKWVAGIYNNDYIPIDYDKTSSKIRFSVHDGTTALGSLETPALDDNWHHIVFTQDVDVETKLYVDGVLQTSETVSHTSMTQRRSISYGSGFYLGENPANNSNDLRYRGKIDQVRIYNSALDATAVENLYNEKPEADTSNFKTVLYEGNGSSQYVSNVGFQPDLVWVKRRDTAMNAVIFDSVRTVGANKELTPSESYSEGGGNSGTYGYINSLDVNGFTLTAGSTNSNLTNADGGDYVAWCWKGGRDAVQNNDGTIQGANCLVSANQDAGFSIVKYAGNSTAGATIGHGLSAKPELILIKNLDSSLNWIAYDTNINSVGYLDLPDAFATSRLSWGFNSTDPTDTLITLGSNNAVNANTDDYIAYCFHSVTGYQKIGSYMGTGGTSVNTISFGFAPAFVLIKRTNTTGGWRMFDSTRDTGTRPLRINHSLRANLGGQEYDGTNDPNGYMSFTNDGISFSTTEVNGDLNANGSTYVYLAIA